MVDNNDDEQYNDDIGAKDHHAITADTELIRLLILLVWDVTGTVRNDDGG